MEPYRLLGHAQHLDPDLPAVSLEQGHLKMAGCIHFMIDGHQTNAPPAVAPSGSQFAKGGQHAAGDGAPVAARLLAPRRFPFPAVGHRGLCVVGLWLLATSHIGRCLRFLVRRFNSQCASSAHLTKRGNLRRLGNVRRTNFQRCCQP